MADLRRSIDVMLKSAESVGYHAGAADRDMNREGTYSVAELARQLRCCMREIVELRSQVSSDRATFASLAAQHGQRTKEELMVHFQTLQHATHRDTHEAQLYVKNRLAERDSEYSADKKRLEDALRGVKMCGRDFFDLQETVKDSIDEMRGRVDAAIAMCTSAKVESTLELERERGAMQHRLDLELSRYSELYRKQQHEVEEAKRAMSRETERLSQTIRTHVDDAWQEKSRQMTNRVAEVESHLGTTLDTMKKEVAAINSEVSTTNKALSRELSALQVSVTERLSHIETTTPLLLSKMDKCERRIESVLDSNGKQQATLEVFRETCDRAAAVAGRASDRLQRLDDTLVDRDLRLTSLESQMVQLAGVESFRLELEAVKRSITRLDHATDAAVKAADRSEKALDESRRLVDTTLEKCDAVEKKSARFATKLEGIDQRVVSFAERLVTLEDSRDELGVTQQRIAESVASVASRQSLSEQKLQAAADRSDSATKDLRQKVPALEAQVADALEQLARVAEAESQVEREADKANKRVQKCETLLFNLTENNHTVKTSVDTVSRTMDALSGRLDGAERSLSTLSSATSQIQEITRQLNSLKKRVDEQPSKGVEVARMDDEQVYDLVARAERSMKEQLDAHRRIMDKRIDSLRSASVEQVLPTRVERPADRPPLAPAPEPVLPRKNPYQTDDSERSASVMSQSLPQRRSTFSSDDSSPDQTDPAPPARPKPSYDTESSESTPDRVAAVQPVSKNPFQHSPSDEVDRSESAQREALRKSLASKDNPFTKTTTEAVVPWDNTSDDDDDKNKAHAAEAPKPVAAAQQQQQQQGEAKTPSSKATADMTISLLSSQTGDAKPATAAAAAPKPAAKSTAWNFDADDEEDEESDGAGLGDEELAGIM